MDAIVQLWLVAEVRKQMQFKIACRQPRVCIAPNAAEGVQQQVKNCRIFDRFFRELVNQLGTVKGVCRALQVVAQTQKYLDALSLRDDVEIAPARNQQIGVREQLDVTALAALDLAHTLRDYAQFAMCRRVDRQQTVGFAHVAALQNNGVDAIDALASHGLIILGESVRRKQIRYDSRAS